MVVGRRRSRGEPLCFVGICPVSRQVCRPINPSSDALATLVSGLGLQALRFVLVPDHINPVGTVQLAPEDERPSGHNRQKYLQLLALGDDKHSSIKDDNVNVLPV